MIHFRPLTDADLPMLHEWMNRPHVAEWWDGPVTLEAVTEDYGSANSDLAMVQPFVALEDSRPIGFIQSYVALGAGDGWWEDETDPGVRGIDQFLADGSALNRGLGTRMVRAFVAQIFTDSAVTRVQTDPSPDNARAIRCYEKAGFRRVGEVVTPGGVALLLVCERG